LEGLCSHEDVLISAAQAVAALAAQEGCHDLLGASPLGERLAAAAVAVAGNGLRVWGSDVDSQNVLVIDGLMVSGSQIAEASARAIQAGAAKVVATVLLSAAFDTTHATTKITVLAT
jgi:orotate phosphoribosyltransferase-like protein